MRPTIRIAEPRDFSSRALATLRDVGHVVAEPCAADEIENALRSCDVFWFRLGHRIESAHLSEARCRILACPVTGLDHIDLNACERARVRVVSLRGETEFLRTVRATSELALGLILSVLRHIPAASRSVVGGAWDRDAFRGRELYGKTAGVVGMGRLGTIVADYARAFGMEVIGFDPRDDFPTGVRRMHSLAELFSKADVVTIHVSYDSSTHHLIDRDVLAHARPGAILVNTSRSGVIDEQALLDALHTGTLGGAALDVLSGEPAIRADHPVVRYAAEHDNLLIVPHIGGNTVESFERTECFVAEKVVRALSEEGLLA